MTIVLPKHDENGNRQTFRPVSEKTSLLGHFDEGNLEEITGKIYFSFFLFFYLIH